MNSGLRAIRREKRRKARDPRILIATGAYVNSIGVVETKRGHTLGRVIWEGSAIPNSGIPGEVKAFGAERVIRAPGPGIFKGILSIGEHVEKGDIVAYAGDTPIPAPISGMLRGLLHDGVIVEKGLKSGDVDPRDIKESCWTISDKALAVGGGVLEAALMTINRTGSQRG